LERARTNSTWSTASAEDVLQIYTRQLSIQSRPDEGFDSQKRTSLRTSQRSNFRSTLEPFKRQVSVHSTPDSPGRPRARAGSMVMQPKEDDDVPKSREEG